MVEMLPSLEPAPPADERDARFDAVAAQFAAPLARLALALEDDSSRRAALLDDIHVALWRCLADYGEAVDLRTWVLRVAHNLVAAHQPNTQDRHPQQDIFSESLKRRRELRGQRTLDQSAAPTGNTVQFIQGLKYFDRELVLLYLEGLTAEQAVAVTGLPLAKQEATYQRIAQLLPANARGEWQRWGTDVTPVSRFLVQSRIGDVSNRQRRENRGRIWVGPFVASTVLARALLSNRGWWLTTGAIAVLTVWAFIEAWKMRRQLLAAQSNPTPSRIFTLDSQSFLRHGMERERDELRRGLGTTGWVIVVAVGLLALSFSIERQAGWLWPTVGFASIVFAGVAVLLNSRVKANRLQARIDAAVQLP
jgi:RNA polymerase sigma-70 factor (ECF subfamily)